MYKLLATFTPNLLEMKPIPTLLLISVSWFAACSTESTYECQCSYTLGSIRGDTSTTVTAQDDSSAETACNAFANEVGGNTKCAI